MRGWRPSHPGSDEQRRRANCRAYANVYLRRGKIHRGPCVDCGVDPEDERVEMHHPDYDHPLNVVWLCVPCRRDRIREAAEAGAADWDRGEPGDGPLASALGALGAERPAWSDHAHGEGAG